MNTATIREALISAREVLARLVIDHPEFAQLPRPDGAIGSDLLRLAEELAGCRMDCAALTDVCKALKELDGEAKP